MFFLDFSHKIVLSNKRSAEKAGPFLARLRLQKKAPAQKNKIRAKGENRALAQGNAPGGAAYIARLPGLGDTSWAAGDRAGAAVQQLR